jgi:hypothetical protein
MRFQPSALAISGLNNAPESREFSNKLDLTNVQMRGELDAGTNQKRRRRVDKKHARAPLSTHPFSAERAIREAPATTIEQVGDGGDAVAQQHWYVLRPAAANR